MRYPARILLGCVLTTLPGCIYIPKHQSYDVTIDAVVQNIKCELRDAWWDFTTGGDPRFDWQGNYAATIKLDVKIKETNTATTDASLLNPLSSGGVATVALDGSVVGEATRMESMTFNANMLKEDQMVTGSRKIVLRQNKNNSSRNVTTILEKQTTLISLRQAKDCGDHFVERQDGRMLGGDLGILDYFERVQLAKQAASFDQKNGIGPTKLTYDVDFVITGSAGVAPKFSMLPFNHKTAGAGFKLSGKRENNHSLSLSLTPISAYNGDIDVSATYSQGGGEFAGYAPSVGENIPTVTESTVTTGIPKDNEIQNEFLIQRQILENLDSRLTQ